MRIIISDMNYANHVASFFDLLGFKEIVAKKSPDEILAINKMLRDVNRITLTPSDLPPLKFINFSDSAVRARQVPNDDALVLYSTVWNEFRNIAFAQTSLINLKVLIRGGVTIGDLYFENDVVFGGALNRAYSLESEIAIFPRLVVDRSLVNIVLDSQEDALASLRKFAPDEAKQSKGRNIDDIRWFLQKDFDGVLFLDYLGVFFELSKNTSARGELISAILIMHRNVIVSGLEDYMYNDKLLAKYNWLKNYHNRFVNAESNQLQKLKVSVKSLKI